MKFIKMQGAGNDYVYVDTFRERVPHDRAALARAISDRHFGVGADGLILIGPSERADARMQMFNADGSEAEMCGNGIRCCAKYLFDEGYIPKEKIVIETGAGPRTVWVELDGDVVGHARVDMGRPGLKPEEIPTTLPGTPVLDASLTVDGHRWPVTCVSMGNPHCVLFVEELTDDLVLELGPKIEHHRAFPQRTNVEFVQILSPREVRQRTWERGSGETLACGTGASAVCVAGALTRRTDREVLIHLRGGDLELDWNLEDDRVYMKGPATEVFRGEWPT